MIPLSKERLQEITKQAEEHVHEIAKPLESSNPFMYAVSRSYYVQLTNMVLELLSHEEFLRTAIKNAPCYDYATNKCFWCKTGTYGCGPKSHEETCPKLVVESL